MVHNGGGGGGEGRDRRNGTGQGHQPVEAGLRMVVARGTGGDRGAGQGLRWRAREEERRPPDAARKGKNG